MKAKELKEILSAIPDDTEMCFVKNVPVPEEKLKEMSYPWPWEYEELIFTSYDHGRSDKVLNIFFDKKEEITNG